LFTIFIESKILQTMNHLQSLLNEKETLNANEMSAIMGGTYCRRRRRCYKPVVVMCPTPSPTPSPTPAPTPTPTPSPTPTPTPTPEEEVF
jgi:hypothetical protein